MPETRHDGKSTGETRYQNKIVYLDTCTCKAKAHHLHNQQSEFSFFACSSPNQIDLTHHTGDEHHHDGDVSQCKAKLMRASSILTLLFITSPTGHYNGFQKDRFNIVTGKS